MPSACLLDTIATGGVWALLKQLKEYYIGNGKKDRMMRAIKRMNFMRVMCSKGKLEIN